MVYIYKETRVSLDWAPNDRTVNVNVPGYDPASASKEADHHTENGTHHLIPGDANDDILSGYLATSSSVLFRALHQSPRAILWRVINGGKTLVLMPLDVSRPQSGYGNIASAYNIHFPHSIPVGGVTFFDSPGSHTLYLFVLTSTYHLYTFQLKQSFFTGPDEASRLPNGWCSIYRPSTFLLRSPHFLQALSEGILVATLQDGGLLRLERTIPENDPRSFQGYREHVFSDGSYLSSIKNVIRWGQTSVRYGEKNISTGTVVSIAVTLRYSLLFAISINHQLRVWSLDKGSLLGNYDLLNEPTSSAPSIKNFLEPNPAHLITLIDYSMDPRDMFYLLTLSPAGSGTFKLWGATDDGTSGFTRLVDKYPEHSLSLDPPSFNTMWVIADFGIASYSSSNPALISMWVLWKSNTSSQMQTVKFELNKMPETFNKWVDAARESLLSLKPRTPYGGGPEDISSYWVDWIFQPGRFSDFVIDRALDVYRKNFLSSMTDETELEEMDINDSQSSKACKAVQNVVNIRRNMMIDGDDEDSTRREFDAQWSTFYKICNELDRQCIEALSLSVDPASGLAFVANADTMTVVRKCSESESINRNLANAKPEDMKLLLEHSIDPSNSVFAEENAGKVRALMESAIDLRESLSEALFDECLAALQEETVSPPDASVFDRIDNIYDRCFEGQGRIPQNLYDKLILNLNTINNLADTFQLICSSIKQTETFPGSSKLTVFGEKLLLRGSQEIIHVNYTLIFDLTLLLVFVHTSSGVNIPDLEPFNALYLELIGLLREYEILSWLSKNSWTPSSEDVESEDALRASLAAIRKSPANNLPQIHNFPVLQILLEEDAGPPPSILGSGPATLTSSIQKFIAATNVGHFTNAVTLIASRLLRMNAIRLMGEFMPYLPPTHWSGYIKARMALCRKEWQDANTLFQEVALTIASPKHIPLSSLDALFTPVERSSFSAGLPKYYFHVAELFEKSRIYPEVVVFTKLAYSDLPHHLDEDGRALRSDILSRQFSAALQVPDYDAAYSALIEYSDKALQRKALNSLILAMCDNYAAEEMCEFAFEGLHEEVDEALEKQCEHIKEVATGPQYHKILYSWRMKRGNRRGAASALYDYLKKLQATKTATTRFSESDVRDTYAVLLNCLSCVPRDEAYLFTRLAPEQESRAGVTYVDGTRIKRRVVTIDNIREEYQEENMRTYQYLSGGVFF